MKKKLLLFFAICMVGIPVVSYAHAPNQSYIFLRIYEEKGIDGRFEINVREINKLLGIDLPKNVNERDIAPYVEQIKAYLLEKSAFTSTLGEHKVVFKDVGIFYLSSGDFVQFNFSLTNVDRLPDDLVVYYNAIFEKDSEHRGFLTVEYNWKAGLINNEAIISLYFTPDDPSDTLSLTDTSVWKGFVAMVKQGVWHIWIGLDHILFLLALILPSVVRRTRFTKSKGVSQQKIWEPVLKFKPAFLYIIKIVTFFTIAHTITLSLASLKIVVLPSRLVESIIAFSIGLAAYHNISPIFKGKDWIIAFVFGLFHGFGFASVLGDLGLTGEFLTLSLLGFNIGVEIGQLCIIALMFPFLFILRKSKLYPKILWYGSVLLIVISLYWCVERIFDVNLGVEDYIKSTLYKFAVYLGIK